MENINTHSVDHLAPGANKVASEDTYNGPIEFKSAWLRKHAKEQRSKEAAFSVSPEVIGQAKTIGKAGLAAAAIAGASTLGGYAAHKIKEHLVDRPQYNQAFNKALQLNPELERYNRETLKDYFDLVASASPTVAKNPLLMSQYLKYLLDYKGSINFNAFSDLAKLEGQLQNNQSTGNAHAAINKGLIEGTSKMLLR